jgi:acyl carrier protein
MSSLSPQGRYKLISLFSVVVLLLGVMYAVRVRRLAADIGRSGTYDRVKSILVKQLSFPAEKIEPSTSLKGLGFDELDQVELVMALEEEFDITVSDEEAEKLLTVEDAVRLADSKLKVRRTAKPAGSR